MLQIGDTAPRFEKLDEVLAQGKKAIVYFYPKDNTPGCTAEACSLRDGYAELVKMGFVVLGVSGDNELSHQKFKTAKKLPFELVADTDHSIAVAYGTWGLKKFMGKEYTGMLRTTFVVDVQGKIEKVFDKVKTTDHYNQIINSYKK